MAEVRPYDIASLCFDVRGQKFVVIVGSQISKLATGRKAASFFELLQLGVKRALDIKFRPNANPQEKRRYKEGLLALIPTNPLHVADEIHSQLCEVRFCQWLHQEFRQFKITNPQPTSILKCLQKVGGRLLTTNYDLILEKSKLPPNCKFGGEIPESDRPLNILVEGNYEDIEEVISGPKQAILHLFGTYESQFVFTSSDHESYTSNDDAMAHLQSIFYHSHVLFVGFEKDDPFLNTLYKVMTNELRMRKRLGSTRNRHYILVPKSDVRTFSDHFKGVLPVPYGSSLDELVNFLKMILEAIDSHRRGQKRRKDDDDEDNGDLPGGIKRAHLISEDHRAIRQTAEVVPEYFDIPKDRIQFGADTGPFASIHFSIDVPEEYIPRIWEEALCSNNVFVKCGCMALQIGTGPMLWMCEHHGPEQGQQLDGIANQGDGQGAWTKMKPKRRAWHRLPDCKPFEIQQHVKISARDQGDQAKAYFTNLKRELKERFGCSSVYRWSPNFVTFVCQGREENVKSAIKFLQQQSQEHFSKQYYNKDKSDHQFACEDCDVVWWAYVPKGNAVTLCPTCSTCYKALNRWDQYGYANFECTNCSLKFEGSDRFTKRSSIECPRCSETVRPYRIRRPHRKSLTVKRPSALTLSPYTTKGSVQRNVQPKQMTDKHSRNEQVGSTRKPQEQKQMPKLLTKDAQEILTSWPKSSKSAKEDTTKVNDTSETSSVHPKPLRHPFTSKHAEKPNASLFQDHVSDLQPKLLRTQEEKSKPAQRNPPLSRSKYQMKKETKLQRKVPRRRKFSSRMNSAVNFTRKYGSTPPMVSVDEHDRRYAPNIAKGELLSEPSDRQLQVEQSKPVLAMQTGELPLQKLFQVLGELPAPTSESVSGHSVTATTSSTSGERSDIAHSSTSGFSPNVLRKLKLFEESPEAGKLVPDTALNDRKGSMEESLTSRPLLRALISSSIVTPETTSTNHSTTDIRFMPTALSETETATMLATTTAVRTAASKSTSQNSIQKMVLDVDTQGGSNFTDSDEHTHTAQHPIETEWPDLEPLPSESYIETNVELVPSSQAQMVHSDTPSEVMPFDDTRATSHNFTQCAHGGSNLDVTNSSITESGLRVPFPSSEKQDTIKNFILPLQLPGVEAENPVVFHTPDQTDQQNIHSEKQPGEETAKTEFICDKLQSTVQVKGRSDSRAESSHEVSSDAASLNFNTRTAAVDGNETSCSLDTVVSSETTSNEQEFPTVQLVPEVKQNKAAEECKVHVHKIAVASARVDTTSVYSEELEVKADELSTPSNESDKANRIQLSTSSEELLGEEPLATPIMLEAVENSGRSVLPKASSVDAHVSSEKLEPESKAVSSDLLEEKEIHPKMLNPATIVTVGEKLPVDGIGNQSSAFVHHMNVAEECQVNVPEITVACSNPNKDADHSLGEDSSEEHQELDYAPTTATTGGTITTASYGIGIPSDDHGCPMPTILEQQSEISMLHVTVQPESAINSDADPQSSNPGSGNTRSGEVAHAERVHVVTDKLEESTSTSVIVQTTPDIPVAQPPYCNADIVSPEMLNPETSESGEESHLQTSKEQLDSLEVCLIVKEISTVKQTPGRRPRASKPEGTTLNGEVNPQEEGMPCIDNGPEPQSTLSSDPQRLQITGCEVSGGELILDIFEAAVQIGDHACAQHSVYNPNEQEQLPEFGCSPMPPQKIRTSLEEETKTIATPSSSPHTGTVTHAEPAEVVTDKLEDSMDTSGLVQGIPDSSIAQPHTSADIASPQMRPEISEPSGEDVSVSENSYLQSSKEELDPVCLVATEMISVKETLDNPRTSKHEEISLNVETNSQEEGVPCTDDTLEYSTLSSDQGKSEVAECKTELVLNDTVEAAVQEGDHACVPSDIWNPKEQEQLPDVSGLSPMSQQDEQEPSTHTGKVACVELTEEVIGTDSPTALPATGSTTHATPELKSKPASEPRTSNRGEIPLNVETNSQEEGLPCTDNTLESSTLSSDQGKSQVTEFIAELVLNDIFEAAVQEGDHACVPGDIWNPKEQEQLPDVSGSFSQQDEQEQRIYPSNSPHTGKVACVELTKKVIGRDSPTALPATGNIAATPESKSKAASESRHEEIPLNVETKSQEEVVPCVDNTLESSTLSSDQGKSPDAECKTELALNDIEEAAVQEGNHARVPSDICNPKEQEQLPDISSFPPVSEQDKQEPRINSSHTGKVACFELTEEVIGRDSPTALPATGNTTATPELKSKAVSESRRSRHEEIPLNVEANSQEVVPCIDNTLESSILSSDQPDAECKTELVLNDTVEAAVQEGDHACVPSDICNPNEQEQLPDVSSLSPMSQQDKQEPSTHTGKVACVELIEEVIGTDGPTALPTIYTGSTTHATPELKSKPASEPRTSNCGEIPLNVETNSQEEGVPCTDDTLESSTLSSDQGKSQVTEFIAELVLNDIFEAAVQEGDHACVPGDIWNPKEQEQLPDVSSFSPVSQQDEQEPSTHTGNVACVELTEEVIGTDSPTALPATGSTTHATPELKSKPASEPRTSNCGEIPLNVETNSQEEGVPCTDDTLESSTLSSDQGKSQVTEFIAKLVLNDIFEAAVQEGDHACVPGDICNPKEQEQASTNGSSPLADLMAAAKSSNLVVASGSPDQCIIHHAAPNSPLTADFKCNESSSVAGEEDEGMVETNSKVAVGDGDESSTASAKERKGSIAGMSAPYNETGNESESNGYEQAVSETEGELVVETSNTISQKNPQDAGTTEMGYTLETQEEYALDPWLSESDVPEQDTSVPLMKDTDHHTTVPSVIRKPYPSTPVVQTRKKKRPRYLSKFKDKDQKIRRNVYIPSERHNCTGDTDDETRSAGLQAKPVVFEFKQDISHH